jgi:restriction endonuclease S subunit
MKSAQLKDIYDISQGVVLARLKSDVGDSVRVVQTRNFSNLEVSGEVELILLGQAEKLRRLRANDVLINLKSIPVRASVVTEQHAGSVASSNIAILTAKPGAAETLDPVYLAGLLRSRFMNHIFFSHIGGESVTSFNLRSLSKLPVPVPPHDKQLVLSEAFQALERYVSLTQQLVETHTERLEVALSSYLEDSHDA